jgi:hypothetical protein
MARVARLAGALIAETNGEYFLVGDTKVPCDWTNAGFERPEDRDPMANRFVRLQPRGDVTLEAPCLELGIEGEPLAHVLARRFVIERNGSVSERLWRLVVQHGDLDTDDEAPDRIDAAWLGEIPDPIWNVVRDAVLRCL